LLQAVAVKNIETRARIRTLRITSSFVTSALAENAQSFENGARILYRSTDFKQIAALGERRKTTFARNFLITMRHSM